MVILSAKTAFKLQQKVAVCKVPWIFPAFSLVSFTPRSLILDLSSPCRLDVSALPRQRAIAC